MYCYRGKYMEESNRHSYAPKPIHARLGCGQTVAVVLSSRIIGLAKLHIASRLGAVDEVGDRVDILTSTESLYLALLRSIWHGRIVEGVLWLQRRERLAKGIKSQNSSAPAQTRVVDGVASSYEFSRSLEGQPWNKRREESSTLSAKASLSTAHVAGRSRCLWQHG